MLSIGINIYIYAVKNITVSGWMAVYLSAIKNNLSNTKSNELHK